MTAVDDWDSVLSAINTAQASATALTAVEDGLDAGSQGEADALAALDKAEEALTGKVGLRARTKLVKTVAAQ